MAQDSAVDHDPSEGAPAVLQPHQPEQPQQPQQPYPLPPPQCATITCRRKHWWSGFALIYVALSPLIVVGLATVHSGNGFIVIFLFHIISCIALPLLFIRAIHGRQAVADVTTWFLRDVWLSTGSSSDKSLRRKRIGSGFVALIVFSGAIALIGYLVRDSFPPIESLYQVDRSVAGTVVFVLYFVLVNPSVENWFWRSFLPLMWTWHRLRSEEASAASAGAGEARDTPHGTLEGADHLPNPVLAGCDASGVHTLNAGGPPPAVQHTVRNVAAGTDACSGTQLPRLCPVQLVLLSMAYSSYHLIIIAHTLTTSLATDPDEQSPGEVSKMALAWILFLSFVALTIFGQFLYIMARRFGMLVAILLHTGGDLGIVFTLFIIVLNQGFN